MVIEPFVGVHDVFFAKLVARNFVVADQMHGKQSACECGCYSVAIISFFSDTFHRQRQIKLSNNIAMSRLK